MKYFIPEKFKFISAVALAVEKAGQKPAPGVGALAVLTV
jgi:hypothetical protein